MAIVSCMASDVSVIAKQVENIACIQVPGVAQYINDTTILANKKWPSMPGICGSTR